MSLETQDRILVIAGYVLLILMSLEAIYCMFSGQPGNTFLSVSGAFLAYWALKKNQERIRSEQRSPARQDDD